MGGCTKIRLEDQSSVILALKKYTSHMFCHSADLFLLQSYVFIKHAEEEFPNSVDYTWQTLKKAPLKGNKGH